MRDPDRRAERTPDSVNFSDAVQYAHTEHAGRMHATFVRGARQNIKNFAIFSLKFSAKFA